MHRNLHRLHGNTCKPLRNQARLPTILQQLTVQPSPAQTNAMSSDPTILFAVPRTSMWISLQRELEELRYHLTFAQTEQDLLESLINQSCDLILLALSLSVDNVFELCQRLRSYSAIPIILLAEQKDQGDLICGLSAGADAYMAMPFTVPELHARIQVALRRSGHSAFSSRKSSLLGPEFILNYETRSVQLHDLDIPLTQIEFKLLNFLKQHANTPVAKEVLIKTIWGFEEMGDYNFIEVAVRRLRQKIELEPSNPKYLVTVRGVGYLLKVTE